MPDPVAALIQQILSGQSSNVGLGGNTPAAVGPNPVRDLPTPDVGGAGDFPSTTGGAGGQDLIQLLLQYLPMIAPFIQGMVSLGPGGGSATGSLPGGTAAKVSGDPSQILQQLLQSIGMGEGGSGAQPRGDPLGPPGTQPSGGLTIA